MKLVKDMTFLELVRAIIPYIRKFTVLKIGDVDASTFSEFDASGNATIGGDIAVSGTGPHVIGGSAAKNAGLLITGAFTSTSGAIGGGVVINQDLTLNSTNTTSGALLSIGQSFGSSITTPNDTVTHAVIATINASEPNISKGATDTITLARTVYIAGAPTEGASNYASYAASGNTYLGGTLTVASYERHIQIPPLAIGTPANLPTPVDVGTAGGYQFASAGTQEELHFQWEAPDDWAGDDVTIEVDWLPDSGAMTNPDAVKWVFEYRFIAEGESILNGTQASQSVTYNTTTAQYVTVHSPVTLPFNDANQPIVKQDHLYVKAYRDTTVANDFAGTVVATAFEVIYNSVGLPTSN